MSNEILKLQPERLWKHFYDLSQIPRPTGQMTAVTKWAMDFAKSLGLDTKQDKAGNVLIVKPASAGMESAPTVILQSHLDMVPQKNADTNHDFTKDPIETYIDGNHVRARSTTLGSDNGIGVAAIMAVLEDKSLKHGKIEALFTIDEEVGMIGAFGLQPGFLSGSILLNLDTEEEGELCVGCAGGADINATFLFKEEETPADDVALRITLKGLKGGHSGTNIDSGRANANKLMFRFLKDAVSSLEARLSAVQGGSLRNAIPRESFAIITVPDEEAALEVMDLVADYQAMYNQEYAATENKISFTAEKMALPVTVIPSEIQDSLIHAVVACPNGVISMLTEFKGIVETSTNLAFVEAKDGKALVQFLTRSSSETRKQEICSSIQSVFALAGAKVEIVNPYPGWQPNAKSPTMDAMVKISEAIIGKKAHVQVVHAGLECGIILESTPGLDIVSFGPTITGAHSPDELVEIDTVGRFYTFLVKTLEMLK